jgi:hypothetical protein
VHEPEAFHDSIKEPRRRAEEKSVRLGRHKIKRYGWLPDTPDQRDHLYAAPVVQLKKLAPKVDLRPQRR